jgi:DNA-binding TFAR19-related protein (PDSD5 family)
MDHGRLKRVQELFRQLLEHEPSERGRFLERLRAEDPELAPEVESLLSADQRAVGARRHG